MADKPGGDQVEKEPTDHDGQHESLVSPVSPASPDPRVSPVSAAAEPVRWSQFAEHQTCPLPQLAFDPEGDGAPEPVANLDRLRAHDQDDEEECGGDSASARSTRPTAAAASVVELEPDTRDPRGAAVVYAEPDRSWVSRHKSYIIAGLVVALVVLTGVTVGVVVTGYKRDSGDGGGDGTSSATPVSSWSARPSSTSSATSPAKSPTSLPSACASPDGFVAGVSWMGIEGAAGGWRAAYAAAGDAAACCAVCHGAQPAGCDGWAWMPVAGSPGTACNMIVGYAGADNDTACPSGHTGVTLSTDADDASHVGGAGPCATLAG